MNLIEKTYDDLRYKTGCYYTSERNKQIIISLLKKYGVKKVVVSPGATNFALVGSMQHDSFFEMFSCVDERAAAYMAIGIAEKSSEPVVLSCTGATASRNYMAALTYAYKRNLPILVITSSLSLASVGQLKAQVTDREHSPIDMIYRSYQFDNIKDSEDEWKETVKCNEAINQLLLVKKPILVNVCTTYSLKFGVKTLPDTRYIPTYTERSMFPLLPETNIGIFVGSHRCFGKEEVTAIERFCERNNAVVMCDHTSGYKGKYRVNMSLPFSQELYTSKNREVGLLIHLGEISGDYYTFGGLCPKQVWRVNEDGAYSDFFKKLTAVFKVSELDFFAHYGSGSKTSRVYYESCKDEVKRVYESLPEIPFSNLWIASQLHGKLPGNSQLHLGILNSLRSWDFFELPAGVESVSNVGGFGIDGCVSSMIGAAIASPEKLFYAVVGDLTFYYDSNILLNKSLPKNFRLIVVNNGRGIEFRNYCHPSSMVLGNSVDSYVAAAGHFGGQHCSAIEGLCRDADIQYFSITSKDDLKKVIPQLTSPKGERAMVIECFTEPSDESDALYLYRHHLKDTSWRKRKIRIALGKIKRTLGL